jgi:hypothetical protein
MLLDDVTDDESMKRVLWKTRHLITGSSDFYSDQACMRNLDASVKAEAAMEAQA